MEPILMSFADHNELMLYYNKESEAIAPRRILLLINVH